MLENIKSPFIKKKIFSQIHDKVKLELIKYNKKNQKVLNIDIINYKLFRGISIILESDKKGKEYDYYNNRVIFQGEYKNLKRNGKGKEYNNKGVLLFEGEYLNNKRNGKGKEYFSNGNIKFEGEYLNGRKRKGKGYDKNNKKIFEIQNGKGHVKEYIDFENYLIFEGEYLNGEKNGKGKVYNNEGKLIFEGEYLNGKRHGKGIKYYSNTITSFIDDYDYIKGKRLSKLIDLYPGNTKKFDGEYFKGKKWNGKGYKHNGDIIYELKNGKGIIKEYLYDRECNDLYSELIMK